MAFALLLLGLLPVMFLADLFGDQDEEPEDTAENDDVTQATQSANNGDFFADDDQDQSEMPGLGSGTDPLQPINEDDEPSAGSGVNPDEVLSPVMEDEEPHEGSEIDPDDVLSPIDAPGDDYSGNGTTLQRLLDSDSDFNTGLDMLAQRIGDIEETHLGSGDNLFSAFDDGESATGTGELSDWDGTPILSDEMVDVVSGGAGNDEITLGDRAGYAFGGAGDDTLSAGEGMAALLGGTGDDSITGHETGLGLWADGGEGNDTITGGDADDTLFGGAHSAGNEAVQDDDTILGGGGDDRIAGGFGADTLLGGAGNDVINHLGRVEEEIHWERHDFGWHIDNDADTLDGGDGNDTLIMDRADTATGGAGFDTFWVYFDGASGTGAADVGDFSSGEDFLRISLNPELDHGDMAVSVDPSEDGADGLVRVNGETVAILRGAPEATSADVYVEIARNIFVA